MAGVEITATLLVGWAVSSVWLSGWQHSFSITMPLALSFLWLTVFTLACFGIGGLTWRLVIGRPANSPTEHVLALGLGAGALAACAGALSVAGLMTKFPVLLVLTIAAGGGGISLHRQWPGLTSPFLPRRYVVVLITAGVIAVLGASSLAAFYDQWNYHLAFPFQWLREGTIVTFPRHAYSFFPANMGLLYVYGLAAGGAWAAQLVHFWMGALSVAAAAALASRFFPSSGAVAAVLFAATPGVIELASVAGAELGVAAFFLCGWIAVLGAVRASDAPRRWYVVTGIFVGLMVGCKYLAILLLAIPFGLVLPLLTWPMNKDRRPGVATFNAVLIVTITAIVVWSPWAIRNVIETGDPVYPFLSGARVSLDEYGADHGTETADGIGEFGFEKDRLLFSATLGSFDHRDVGGRVGPLFLWLMPLWLLQLIHGGASRQERVFSLSLFLGLLGAAAVPSFGRYLVPLAAACAVGCGVAFQRLTGRLGKIWRVVLNAVLFILLIGNLNPFPLGNLPRQIGVTLGVVDQTEFLSTFVSHYPAIEYINRELPDSAVIYLLAEARSYEINRQLVLEDPISKPMVVEIAESSASTGDMIAKFRALGVTHILVNQVEANRTAKYNKRGEYIATDDPAARQRINEFFDSALPLVWRDRHLFLFQLPRTSEIER